MNGSGVESIREAISLYKTQIVSLAAICMVLFLLTLVSLFVLDPGSAGYVISVVNFVTLAVILTVIGIVLWFSRNYE